MANHGANRITLSQLFVAIALLAVVLAFTQSEGCGWRQSRIGTVVFSPDGGTVAVARYDARDAVAPGKIYLANVSRTVSLLDSTDGSRKRVIERLVRSGNWGPATLRFVKRAVDFFNDDCLILREFEEGDIKFVDLPSGNTNRKTEIRAYAFALSKDRRQLLAFDYDQVHAWALPESKRVSTFASDFHLLYSSGTGLSISADNTLAAIASWEGMLVRELATGETVFEMPTDSPTLVDVAFIPADGRIAIASDDSLRLLDLVATDNVETLLERGISCMTVSPDGTYLATNVGEEPGVWLHDLRSGQTTRFLAKRRATALDFSGDGKLLAAGDDTGRVSMIDTTTGQVLWAKSAPGRYRPPWTFPVALFAIWVWACRRCSSKRTKSMEGERKVERTKNDER